MPSENQKTVQSTDNQLLFGLFVDSEVLFSNHKNIYKRRIEKRQRKLLEKISFIKTFLNPDEKILLLTTGCSPASLLEQILTGWIVFQLKRSLFVFTNQRIFHIPTKPDFSYRNSIAQFNYADCQRLYLKGSVLVAKYKTGRTDKFICMTGKERKKIKALLQATPLQGIPNEIPERTHLCPRCTARLIPENYICPNCSFEFKNKAEARKISIIYPGGGYFYTGHPVLGVLDAFAELMLMIAVLTSFTATIRAVSGGTFDLIFFGLLLTIEKMATIYHSNHFIKEYIPKKRQAKIDETPLIAEEAKDKLDEPDTEDILSVR
jgi:hypothetical protein